MTKVWERICWARMDQELTPGEHRPSDDHPQADCFPIFLSPLQGFL